MNTGSANAKKAEPGHRPLPDGPDPASLLRTLEDDVRTVRVGNSAPESVPVFQDHKDPSVRFVRFADLSANVRRILDVCESAEIRIDGDRADGERAWRDVDGHRGPVLQWNHEARTNTWSRRQSLDA